ncbi:MAG: GC-type dockerin domain-anchored protein [Planctomycetota bacterium]
MDGIADASQLAAKGGTIDLQCIVRSGDALPQGSDPMNPWFAPGSVFNDIGVGIVINRFGQIAYGHQIETSLCDPSSDVTRALFRQQLSVSSPTFDLLIRGGDTLPATPASASVAPVVRHFPLDHSPAASLTCPSGQPLFDLLGPPNHAALGIADDGSVLYQVVGGSSGFSSNPSSLDQRWLRWNASTGISSYVYVPNTSCLFTVDPNDGDIDTVASNIFSGRSARMRSNGSSYRYAGGLNVADDFLSEVADEYVAGSSLGGCRLIGAGDPAPGPGNAFYPSTDSSQFVTQFLVASKHCLDGETLFIATVDVAPQIAGDPSNDETRIILVDDSGPTPSSRLITSDGTQVNVPGIGAETIEPTGGSWREGFDIGLLSPPGRDVVFEAAFDRGADAGSGLYIWYNECNPDPNAAFNIPVALDGDLIPGTPFALNARADRSGVTPSGSFTENQGTGFAAYSPARRFESAMIGGTTAGAGRGAIYFQADLEPAPGQPDLQAFAGVVPEAIMVWTSSRGLRIVAKTGDDVPGSPGEKFVEFRDIDVNESGQLVFTASFTDAVSTVTRGDGTGVFLANVWAETIDPDECLRIADISIEGPMAMVTCTTLDVMQVSGDGLVRLSDFSCYLNLWSAQDPSADITATGSCEETCPDGLVDLSDFNCYLAIWSACQ